MKHYVKIPLKYDTYHKLAYITKQLNDSVKEPLSSALGDIFTQMTCEVLEQVFVELIRTQALRSTTGSGESQKILTQISEQLQKYLPMAIKLFGNDRLKPVANYILSKVIAENEQAFLCYEVPLSLITSTKKDYILLQQGQESKIVPVFEHLIKIIDVGVTELIREPKNMLNFNFVMDKTLNGVVLLATSLGYKRIEKIGASLDLKEAQNITRHFNQFVHTE